MREKLIKILETVVSPKEVLCDGEVLVSTARVADHLIANGVTFAEDNNVPSKWIPVTERLPKLYEDCFVYVKLKYDWEEDYEYHVDAGCYVGECGYIGSFNTYNDWNEGQEDIQITHWMPLPEPPKGE